MVHIRDAAISDLPMMLDIYNDAVRNLVATFDLEEQSLAQREVWFRKYGGKYPLIVAETDGAVAGYCCLSSFREKPAYGKTAELSVYIGQEHRGQGLGTVLMAEIIERAKQLDYHTIVSSIAGGNQASVTLHEKFGFFLVGKFREVGFKFGEWQDIHFYQLMLGE